MVTKCSLALCSRAVMAGRIALTICKSNYPQGWHDDTRWLARRLHNTWQANEGNEITSDGGGALATTTTTTTTTTRSPGSPRRHPATQVKV
ncbi:hypothetical protein E2C01_025476 [Portunus trituberculatus]|uniref:Secreted protein n=1 Tax=Portunus trituberculatus TaxID=210409 RepID=A0A5B7EDE8_PORTR|nr:hypothetical protein [Portunus trituberculatus]